MSISKYYNSPANIILSPKIWSPVEEVVWRSAFLGQRDVQIETNRNKDNNQLDHAHKIMEEMIKIGLIDVKEKCQPSRFGSYYIVKGYFPDILLVEKSSEPFQVYINSVKRVITQIQNFNEINNRCCRVLDELFIDSQIATNKGQRWVTIRNPIKDNTNVAYDSASWEIIRKELACVPNLKFKIINMQWPLWDEEVILVWNWNTTNLPNDSKLSKSEAPDWMFLEINNNCNYIE
jgi:hypothetical protein